MAWLVRDDVVLAPVELARRRRDRARGLLGRDGIDGALLLAPARSVHTVGMRFAIDVAHCRALDGDREDSAERLAVLRVTTMRPGRVGRPVWRAGVVLEAAAGAFAAWGVEAGTVVGVRTR